MEHNEAQAAGLVTNQLLDAAGSTVMSLRGADVGRNREDQRRRRLWRLATFTGLPAMLLWWRSLAGEPMHFFRPPHVDPMVGCNVGAIAFIEEIDAIGVTRRGLSMTAGPELSQATIAQSVQCCCGVATLPSSFLTLPATATNAATVSNGFVSEGVGGVVNELLVQMQSFDHPTGWQKVVSKLTDSINLLLPMHRQIKKQTPPKPNVLVIAATNRADSLDPALLRPGRFDRVLTFERPDMRGRRDLLDFYLNKKAHAPELDDDERRAALASITHGYTPVMSEHLLDEGLVNAVRRGDVRMNWKDVEQARLTGEVGLGQPVTYTDHERELIATHEAGPATAAYLVAPDRRLQVRPFI